MIEKEGKVVGVGAWVMTNRFTALLCGLVILLIASPIVNTVRTGPPGKLSRVLLLVCFVLMSLSALFAISNSRRHLITAGALSVPALFLQLSDAVKGHDVVRGLSYGFTILFLGYLVVIVIGSLFRSKSVTADMICASICAYLLIGVCWAFMYSLTNLLLPGSFYVSDAHQLGTSLGMSGTQSGFANYYSFVTLTSLGYGDVVHVNPVSRALSYLEAVLGQIFMAVLVARLVGLQLSQSIAERSSKSKNAPNPKGDVSE